MNKRIKKKRKIERYIASLIVENEFFFKELSKQHERIEQLEKIVEHNAQATNNELSRIKKHSKKKWKNK
ncbi:TPA: hypothetical protein U7H52_001396 [Streptococcus agalactiae]|uniref:hypothetical protein n=1 Tax=Streptococcus agalactiae TaxID=1311 RepID=UPI0002BBEA4D|nr:hypothetical protein [Streptococcus agalactiae]DAV93054.1 MAG TPA: hypothetical protein [Caudoviricetes sp.]AIK72259.1 hypothetical protein DK41_08995 [Streptococcus agalactiae]EPT57592.1 hypothetical protein SAG0053_10040 [Streptococcus agalactiae CCUG 25532]EPV58722.1 hypothetical protein SAG0359_06805 [Streptococcus agalactiae GB00922]EPW82216.1 hypothetical protein SAG0112_04990 [Streptococcus agalactiae MRI Z1-199]